MNSTDTEVRLMAFRFLDEQTKIHGDVLPLKVLQRGFDYQGQRVPLMAPQGIFTPRILDVPLTFCTVPPSMKKERPYDDKLGDDGVMLYRYRGSDPQHRDNVGMRKAMVDGIPLIYLFGIVPGQYMPVYPVFVVGDSPNQLSFSVKVDERAAASPDSWIIKDGSSEAKRSYITIETQRRLHQRGFRERVLTAYRRKCAVCNLKHIELLEAAHILPDTHPLGDPIIPNGLSLCKLHHAAYDKNIMGITPDCVIEIREDILQEHDGPMLKYGLQETQGQRLWTPRTIDYKPNPEFLEIRFADFKRVG